MDVTLIQSTITGLKLAGDIAKSFLELKSIADVQGKVIELQSAILSAQSSALAANSDQSAMAEEIRALKKEIAEVKAWEAEKQRYALKALEPSIFTYALKHASANGEPPHWLCANCHNKGIKSILQFFYEVNGVNSHICHCCKSEIKANSQVLPSF